MKKGFTLIEVIAVVALMGLIMIIVVPSVTKVMQNSKEKLNEAQQKIIIEAGSMAYAENSSILQTSGNIKYVLVSDLIEEGYLTDQAIVDLVTNKELMSMARVEISEENNNIKYIFANNDDIFNY